MPTDENHNRSEASLPDDAPRLAPADANALDALIDARASGEAPEAEASRVASLLALLDTPVGGQPGALVDLTYLKVRRAGAPIEDQRLSPASADALDAWVQSGYDAGHVPATYRDEATQHERLRELCTAPLADEALDREVRVQRVLDRIQNAIDEQGDRLRLDTRRTGFGSLRLADVVSIAAMLLLATAIVLPVLSSVRQGQQVAMCRSNFAGVGSAMGMYANSHGSALPMASAGLGGSWIDVGTTPERSNSANLYLLARTNHVPLEQLACPGNPEAPTVRLSPTQQDWSRLEEVSYSYQVTPVGVRPRWGTNQKRIVLADRSPVILRVVRGDPFNPRANSTNHAGEGQHALHSDGSAQWLESPIVEGDNIWLPRQAEDAIRDHQAKLGIRGDERPTSPSDVFLAP
jgi:hypothetical protein